MLEEALPGGDFADLQLPFHCVAASIGRASAHWFSRGPVVPENRPADAQAPALSHGPAAAGGPAAD